MTSPDIHALTGAYALDAVAGVERADFERHLAECESCAQEVQELRETAARLAVAVAEPPPPHLKNQVLDRIRTVRQLPPETAVVPLRRRSLAQRLTTVAAAVFFVATAGLGVVVVRQNNALDDARAQAAQLEQFLTVGDAQLVTMADREGSSLTVAVSRKQNKVLLLSDDLASPPEGKTYQLWALTDIAGDAPRSMGTLEPDDGNVNLERRGNVRDASQVAISVEPDGGSKTPTIDQIVMMAPLPTA